MGTLWFCLVAVMITTYVLLDGFDLGAGAIHFIVAKTTEERRQVIATIGPVWDGNEVWLLAAGGTLYFAFPSLYASGFSGFYLPLMISAAKRVKNEAFWSEHYAALRLALIFATLMYGMTEAVFNRLNLIWFALLVAVTDYQGSNEKIDEPLEEEAHGTESCADPVASASASGS